MRLRHYSEAGSLVPHAVAQNLHPALKPRGLWLSDDDAEMSWPEWCRAEEFHLEEFEHAFEIDLAEGANVLIIQDAEELERFGERYGTNNSALNYIQWATVARDYDGIIITPYQWGHRMKEGFFWYYGWDCASGCIWEPRAIAEVKLADVALEVSW